MDFGPLNLLSDAISFKVEQKGNQGFFELLSAKVHQQSGMKMLISFYPHPFQKEKKRKESENEIPKPGYVEYLWFQEV